MTIDIEKLKNDLKNELLGAYYGAGFGGPLIESFKLDSMTPEEIVNLAIRYGFNLENYEINNQKER